MPSERWLVVGLGNPEGEYGGTRHNVGSDVLAVVAERFDTFLSTNKRVRCAVDEVRDGSVRIVLARPLVYMNESGGPVQQAADWYKIPPERVVVLHDDLDLDPGVVRIKFGGGTAGHNGLKSIATRLGSRDFYRVRIGIGRPSGRRTGRDHVLSRFTAQQREQIEVAVEDAADAALGIVHDGLEPTQNRIHPRN